MAFIHNESLNQLITQIQNDANHKYVRKIIGEAEVPVFLSKFYSGCSAIWLWTKKGGLVHSGNHIGENGNGYA